MRIFALALLGVSVFATTAHAQVAGPRVEAVIGFDSARMWGEREGGLVYGLGLGYDVAMGANLSVGVDAEITDSTAKDGYTNAYYQESIKAGRDLYLGARISTQITQAVSAYAKLGYTNARVIQEGSLVGAAPRAQFVEYDTGSNLDGVRLGLGLQYALTGKTYVGAEYRYSNYEQDVVRHQAVATLGYRF